VTGASGLVGTPLTAELAAAGHRVVRAVRRTPVGADELQWDPAGGQIDLKKLAEADAVVHLAGENIAAGRWTASFKDKILRSRVDGTSLIARSLAGLPGGPRTLVAASAIGYYGDRGAEVLTEDSPPGDDFLAEVCREWEAACQPVRDAGLRVANLRIGVVLSPLGGALKKMLTPFRLGGGGVIGSGRQYMSWITLDDLVRAIVFVVHRPEMQGAINLTAPRPVTNHEFTKTLGRVLRRPTLFPMPAFAARLAFGEMADALLLGSAQVQPRRLEEAQFAFHHPQLEEALRSLLA
jgi:uncharacterized protein (TIGR01777 family)